MAAPKEIGAFKSFGGFQKRYEHESSAVGCPMKFSVYLPPAADVQIVPVIYWLSGLTCNDEVFVQKAGAQRVAAELGVALVSPDTSPRGLSVEGESDSWDFGVGAGFYLNATEPKWKSWRMYEYVAEELPRLLAAHFPQLDAQLAGISGHSMGGHGALTLFLKNPGKYKSVSAFAPICNPSKCPWGEKAFSGYLGGDRSAWAAYDATELVKQYKGPLAEVLIDQGDADKFYKEQQLLPEAFRAAAADGGGAAAAVTLRMQPGYDHSYFFISTFIEDHLRHHAKALTAAK